MSNPWIVVVGVVIVGLAYVLFPVVADTYLRFRTKRRLACPEGRVQAQVGLDAAYAALTAAFRRPLLRVKKCSLWPEREACEQSCVSELPEANGAEPVRPEPRESALRQ